MDKKNDNIRLIRTGGRKVTKTTTEYDWSKLDEKARMEKKPQPAKVRREPTEFERKVRYQKQQKQQRLKIQRRRALIVLILAVIIVSVLMFMTPIFNIRSVSVEGNRIVTAEQFQEKLKPLVGENLFRTGSGNIRNTLKTISYIDTVEVQKRMFPPSVKVTVTEYMPVAEIKKDGKSLIVNSELRVLMDEGDNIWPVVAVSGFTVSDYEVGKVLKSDDKEKIDVLTIALKTLEEIEVIDKVIEINVNDIADITMNYDNRITVKCGTQLDLERKLRLFRETVTNNSLAENARGTLEFTGATNAVFNP